eukprot:Stramenopile-MAST_4_protein_1084
MYGSMQAYASGANALASMTSAASYELDVLMSSNGTKDLSKPSGGINIAEKDYRDAEEVKNDGIVSDGKASTSEQHREKYLATYTGLDAYSSEGTTKLEMLIRKARNALENATPGADGVRHGAALLTKTDKVYTGCNIESQVESLCATAERTAVLKACTDGQTDFAGIVLINDDSYRSNTEVLCGSSRQFLAEFGNYPVYIIESDGTQLKFSTYELFPMTASQRLASSTLRTTKNNVLPTHSAARIHGNGRLTEGIAPEDDHNAHQWSVKDVVAWVEERMELPALGGNFARNAVDGPLLLQLCDRDLEDMLNVQLPLHRRKLMSAIDGLRQADLLEYGVDVGRAEEYMALLDVGRIKLVAKLKEAFDKVDKNGDGAVNVDDIRSAFRTLGQDDSSQNVFAWLHKRDRSGNQKVTFDEFVLAYTAMFANDDKELSTKREHVQNSRKRGLSNPKKKIEKTSSTTNTSQKWVSDSLEDTIDFQDPKGGIVPLGVDKIAQLKRVFSVVDGDSDGILSHAECARAYAQLAVKISREDVVAFFKSRGETTRGEVDFYQFTKAFSIFLDREEFQRIMNPPDSTTPEASPKGPQH